MLPPCAFAGSIHAPTPKEPTHGRLRTWPLSRVLFSLAWLINMAKFDQFNPHLTAEEKNKLKEGAKDNGTGLKMEHFPKVSALTDSLCCCGLMLCI